MSTPIDDAVAGVLEILGPGWYVYSTRVDTVDATSMKEALAGDHVELPTTVMATIRHPSGLQAIGYGRTLGNAVARAAINVTLQKERMS